MSELWFRLVVAGCFGPMVLAVLWLQHRHAMRDIERFRREQQRWLDEHYQAERAQMRAIIAAGCPICGAGAEDRETAEA